MNKIFSSDFHFQHLNIIKYCNRPVSSVEEMNELLIENFNKKSDKDSLFYFLGDFSLSKQAVYDFIFRLGFVEMIWILGNHDAAWPGHRKGAAKEQTKIKEFLQSAGRKITFKTEDNIEIGKYRVKLCHFPYLDSGETLEYNLRYKEWRPKKGNEQILLHGHSHSSPENRINLKPYPQIDLGADGNNLNPYTEDEVLELIEHTIGEK